MLTPSIHTPSRLPKRVLIIDDDEATSNLVSQALTQAGVVEVKVFDSGRDGWEHAAKPPFYDVVIMDWKLGDVSGLTLLNRFKLHNHYSRVGLVVISGFLKQKDFTLLAEFILTAQLEKPIQIIQVLQAVSSIYAEALWLQKRELTLNRIVKELHSGSQTPSEAHVLIQQTTQSMQNPLPFVLLAGNLLFEKGFFEVALHMLEQHRTRYGDSAGVLHLLGKIKLQQHDYESAQVLLSIAQGLSPDNLDRLCMLGHVSLHQLEIEEAQQYFAKASKMDAENHKVKAGQQLAQNVSSYLHASPPQTLPKNFASLLNAIGISMVKAQDHEKGIEHYKNALIYVHDAQLQARLAFNVGLGYARWQKPRESLKWLQKAESLYPQFKKASLLASKVTEKFGLSMSHPVPEPTPEWHAMKDVHKKEEDMMSSLGGDAFTYFEYDEIDEDEESYYKAL